jgi:hypothetical protein
LSYSFYRIAHFASLALVFLSLGGLFALARSALGDEKTAGARRFLSATHGTGMFFALVAGFGLLAKLGLGGLPGWSVAKLGIWLVLGGLPVVFKRKPEMATSAFIGAVVLAIAAGGLAIYKPF